MRRVAIEDDLSNVKNYLESRGYQVFPIDRVGLEEIEAVVLRGTDNNLMGMQAIKTNAPIVSAEGRTPEDIYAEIEQKVFRAH
ncbi:MAG: YkuS family protein [Halanaerobium sp.]|nr:YkuS family protein [Halanaerobium sp.]